MTSDKRSKLRTEMPNSRSSTIDQLPIIDILKLINSEDVRVPIAVASVLKQISQLVEACVSALKNNKKIFYIGAGTSGRLGVLDASEIPPTFSASSDMFTAIIAGGDNALRSSIEGAEDSMTQSIKDLKAQKLCSGDVLIGISASGAAKYVISAIDYGKEIGVTTAYITCNKNPLYKANQDILICVETGAEVITGSTRMKAGTATKLILNMISTATMVRIGKVYKNLMVDLKVVNEKLVDRGLRIIKEVAKVDELKAKIALKDANNSVKHAIIMLKKSCSLLEAKKMINEKEGHLNKVI